MELVKFKYLWNPKKKRKRGEEERRRKEVSNSANIRNPTSRIEVNTTPEKSINKRKRMRSEKDEIRNK